MMDVYIISASKFEATIPDNLNVVYNVYNITNFEPISFNGIVTENIMSQIINCNTTCVSKCLPNHKEVIGIVVRPTADKVTYDFKTFIQLNFFDKKHVIETLGIKNYYDIFDPQKMNVLKMKFEGRIEKVDFKIEERFETFCKEKLDNYVILNEIEIENYIKNLKTHNGNVSTTPLIVDKSEKSKKKSNVF